MMNSYIQRREPLKYFWDAPTKMEVTVFHITNLSLWNSYEDISHQLFPLPPVTVTDLKSAPLPWLPHKSVSSWPFKSSLNADNVRYLNSHLAVAFPAKASYSWAHLGLDVCVQQSLSLSAVTQPFQFAEPSLKSSHGQINTGGLWLQPGHTRGLSKGSWNVAHESGWRFCAYFAKGHCMKTAPKVMTQHRGHCIVEGPVVS